MALEKFNQTFGQRELLLKKYDQPEDELETPEVVALLKRERAFAAEGGFKELVKLKICIEDLFYKHGMLSPSFTPDYIRDTIDDPLTYAWSNLGIDMNNTKPSPDELQEALKKFLAKAKISKMAEIGEYKKIILTYINTTKSEALDALSGMLNDCENLVIKDDWKGFSRKALIAKSYLSGVKNIVDVCCGGAVEQEETRKILK